jgi:prepilin-type N-terminal cleavage/methylation domain-containing protein
MKSRSKFSRGFTLIELLVVMTIIAVLAGGIFAAASAAIRKARGVQAQNMAVGLANGINNFRSDYGRWPLPAGATSTSDYKETVEQVFLDNLLGKDTTKNKRGRNFLDTMPIGKNNSGGLIYSGTKADLYDPWGQKFTVAIDANNDGQIANPDGGTPATLMIKVGVLSPGSDRKLDGSNDEGKDATLDNIRSW